MPFTTLSATQAATCVVMTNTLMRTIKITPFIATQVCGLTAATTTSSMFDNGYSGGASMLSVLALDGTITMTNPTDGTVMNIVGATSPGS